LGHIYYYPEKFRGRKYALFGIKIGIIGLLLIAFLFFTI